MVDETHENMEEDEDSENEERSAERSKYLKLLGLTKAEVQHVPDAACFDALEDEAAEVDDAVDDDVEELEHARATEEPEDLDEDVVKLMRIVGDTSAGVEVDLPTARRAAVNMYNHLHDKMNRKKTSAISELRSLLGKVGASSKDAQDYEVAAHLNRWDELLERIKE